MARGLGATWDLPPGPASRCWACRTPIRARSYTGCGCPGAVGSVKPTTGVREACCSYIKRLGRPQVGFQRCRAPASHRPLGVPRGCLQHRATHPIGPRGRPPGAPGHGGGVAAADVVPALRQHAVPPQRLRRQGTGARLGSRARPVGGGYQGRRDPKIWREMRQKIRKRSDSKATSAKQKRKQGFGTPPPHDPRPRGARAAGVAGSGRHGPRRARHQTPAARCIVCVTKRANTWTGRGHNDGTGAAGAGACPPGRRCSAGPSRTPAGRGARASPLPTAGRAMESATPFLATPWPRVPNL